jgi:Arc/MetJ-type ribon-helix-helix transcriptional regulator
MSIQIAVRLPDDVVKFVDELVSSGQAGSRAEVVSRALAREQRQRAAEHDAAILLAHAGEPHDLDGLVEWASAHPLNLDD